MIGTLRWLGFAAGLAVAAGTIVGVMKTFIVPRRSWSLLPALIGRNGFRLFRAVALRLGSFDRADRLLGFLAPTVIIGILASFLASHFRPRAGNHWTVALLAAFDAGVDCALRSGFPGEGAGGDASERFARLRADYAELAHQLAYWTVATPAPWSGPRPDLAGA